MFNGAAWITIDELGNLVKVVLGDNTTIDYIIDGRGRRVGKKRNRADIPGFMVKYTNSATSGIYRILSDHLGSPRMVVNATNASDRLLEARYTAFGIPTVMFAFLFGFGVGAVGVGIVVSGPPGWAAAGFGLLALGGGVTLWDYLNDAESANDSLDKAIRDLGPFFDYRKRQEERLKELSECE